MTPKPAKTLADYTVIGISPVLIMLLVGSLSFFLIQVFYRGEAVGSVRWVLFWFVMAVVLVSRIGIEQGTTHAAAYGLALAAATWLYLMQIHPAYLLGVILLGIVWWCAHKLTWDCTLIDEDEDASGSGLLKTAEDRRKVRPDDTETRSAERGLSSIRSGRESQAACELGQLALQQARTDRKRRASVPHPPGLWVVYFSLVALPLFGIGQMLLPGGDTASRLAGFVHLFVYLAAAVGLLLTTSFLGLRRYLRQRYLQMPGTIAFGWLKFGAGVACLVLVAALLLPRPGVNDAWLTLRYQIDYRLHQASAYASRINPQGTGRGRAGGEPQKSNGSTGSASTSQADKAPTAGDHSQSQAQAGRSEPAQDQTASQDRSGPGRAEGAAGFYRWFRILVILAAIILAGWWVFRRRHLLLEIAQSLIAALAQFFRNLFQLDRLVKQTTAKAEVRTSRPHPFATYQSPFLTGKDKSWTAEQLILYSYEALQAWAVEQSIQLQPEQTAREFCLRLGQTFPDAASELNRLAFLYGHAAYGFAVPAGCDLEPVKKLWRYLSAVAAGDMFASSPN
jgi:hypothetical protein